MSLCFVDPADAIRAIADSIGREARRQLLGEAVRAWVDEIPDTELEVHYAKAISELDEHDLSMLAAWHGSLEVGHPVPNRDFLMGAFGSLGENRREALKLAAGFRGEEAVDAGVTEEDALELVLGLLSPPRLMELAVEARRALRLGPRRLRQLIAADRRSMRTCRTAPAKTRTGRPVPRRPSSRSSPTSSPGRSRKATTAAAGPATRGVSPGPSRTRLL